MIVHDECARPPFLRAVLRRTEALIEQPAWWQAIQAVALALIERRAHPRLRETAWSRRPYADRDLRSPVADRNLRSSELRRIPELRRLLDAQRRHRGPTGGVPLRRPGGSP